MIKLGLTYQEYFQVMLRISFLQIFYFIGQVLGTVNVPARELLLITMTSKRKLLKRGSYPEGSLSAFHQLDYVVNTVLAVSLCLKSSKWVH